MKKNKKKTKENKLTHGIILLATYFANNYLKTTKKIIKS